MLEPIRTPEEVAREKHTQLQGLGEYGVRYLDHHYDAFVASGAHAKGHEANLNTQAGLSKHRVEPHIETRRRKGGVSRGRRATRENLSH